MGQFHFEVPPHAESYLESILWEDAYLCGIEGIPFQTKVVRDGNRLTLSRNVDSSARLIVTCLIPGLGYRTLSTCSLAANADGPAYALASELARGGIANARAQCDAWERSGLALNDKYTASMSAAISLWLDSVTSPLAQVEHEKSVESFTHLQTAIDELADLFAMQAISFRKNREVQLGTLMAAAISPPEPLPSKPEEDASDPLWADYSQTFNAIAVRMSWADIETDSGSVDFDATDRVMKASQAAGLRIIAGPMIDFRERLMPHWLYLLEDNFESFLNATVKFVEQVVQRYRGQVQLWNCATALNTPGPLPLSDEQAMRLAVGILQTVRRTDPNTAAILSFDQPSGEYLAKYRNAISPIHFADAIIRSGLGMAGLGLDLRIGYKTGATFPKSAIEIGQLVDRWSTLGMPLLVTLATPGGSGRDVLAAGPTTVLESPEFLSDCEGDQLRVAGPIVRTLLAKHVVHGIVWDGWHDGRRHITSHSGLIDSLGHARPMLTYLKRLRQNFLT
jgi:hypothetical protein